MVNAVADALTLSLKKIESSDGVTLLKEVGDAIDGKISEDSGSLSTRDWILIISGGVLLLILLGICIHVRRERQDNYRKP